MLPHSIMNKIKIISDFCRHLIEIQLYFNGGSNGFMGALIQINWGLAKTI